MNLKLEKNPGALTGHTERLSSEAKAGTAKVRLVSHPQSQFHGSTARPPGRAGARPGCCVGVTALRCSGYL